MDMDLWEHGLHVGERRDTVPASLEYTSVPSKVSFVWQAVIT